MEQIFYLANMWKESILKLLRLDNLVNNLTDYVETRLELVKLEVKEEIAKAIARITIMIFVMMAFTLFIIFISITLALWLATFWGYVMGFGAVALFYFLMLIIVLALRQTVSAALEEKLKEKLND